MKFKSRFMTVALASVITLSQIQAVNAFGDNQLIDNTKAQTLIKATNKEIKDNAKAENLPKYPELNGWTDSGTPRVGESMTKYIGGLSFENTDPHTYKDISGNDMPSAGLRDIQIASNTIVDFENPSNMFRGETSNKLNKIVVPHINIEAYNSDSVNSEGLKVTLVLGTNSGIGYNDIKISEIFKEGEDIEFTRDEILTAIKDEMKRLNLDIPADDDIYIPDIQTIMLRPIDGDGNELSNRGITKLEQTKPIEFQYTTLDVPTEESDAKSFSSYFVMTSYKDAEVHNTYSPFMNFYSETSDINVTADKTKDLNPGDVVTLDIEVKNTTKYSKNIGLMGGFDIIKSDGNEEKYGEFEVRDENDANKIWAIEPGQTLTFHQTYTIPADYKGKTIELKPYLSGMVRTYDQSLSLVSETHNDKDRQYNQSVILNLKQSTGGGGGGDVDPLPPAPDTSDIVIVASGQKYTDVLTATVLANEKNAPILLATKDNIDDKTLAEIERLDVSDVIVVGGEASVSEQAVSKLTDYNVTRIAGQDRYETSIKIGNEVRNITGNESEAMLVDGTNFPDVITISTLASQKRAPILLTEPAKLNSKTQDTLKTWGIDDVTIGGSYNSVSKDVENNLEVSEISRFGGANRYQTAKLISDEVRSLTGSSKTDLVLVDGTNFPDGLTINSIAANLKAPIMLTAPKNLPQVTADSINTWSINNLVIGGGYNSVSKEVEDRINIANKERLAGQDRYETAVKISQKLSELK